MLRAERATAFPDLCAFPASLAISTGITPTRPLGFTQRLAAAPAQYKARTMKAIAELEPFRGIEPRSPSYKDGASPQCLNGLALSAGFEPATSRLENAWPVRLAYESADAD